MERPQGQMSNHIYNKRCKRPFQEQAINRKSLTSRCLEAGGMRRFPGGFTQTLTLVRNFKWNSSARENKTGFLLTFDCDTCHSKVQRHFTTVKSNEL